MGLGLHWVVSQLLKDMMQAPEVNGSLVGPSVCGCGGGGGGGGGGSSSYIVIWLDRKVVGWIGLGAGVGEGEEVAALTP